MPAGMVRPRASLAPTLGPAAIAQYRACGWRIAPFGRVDAGIVGGACAGCGGRCVRYGPHGSPLCENCTASSALAGVPDGA